MINGVEELGSAGRLLPVCLIATRAWGVFSEVWMRRQVEGFRSLLPVVAAWDVSEEPAGWPVMKIPFPADNQLGLRRWVTRGRNLFGGNWFGAVGGEYRFVLDLLRRQQPRVVLCHFGFTALRLLPAAGRAGVPLVAHFHGTDISASLRNAWYRRSLERSLSSFAAMVVVGRHQAAELEALGAEPEKVHLIPCGVPTQFFQPPADSNPITFGSKRGPVFVIAARLVPWKGVDVTLRALAQVRKELSSARLIVCGDGPMGRSLRQLATDLGVSEAVEFRGALPAEHLREVLAEGDVFVQHSLTAANGWVEGFGVSLAEAASMGLPVVATRSGGIVDQVEDGKTGLLVHEHSVDETAAAMLRFGRDPGLRHSMGQAGRRRMVSHFDLPAQIAKLEQVLLRAAASEGGALTDG